MRRWCIWMEIFKCLVTSIIFSTLLPVTCTRLKIAFAKYHGAILLSTRSVTANNHLKRWHGRWKLSVLRRLPISTLVCYCLNQILSCTRISFVLFRSPLQRILLNRFGFIFFFSLFNLRFHYFTMLILLFIFCRIFWICISETPTSQFLPPTTLYWLCCGVTRNMLTLTKSVWSITVQMYVLICFNSIIFFLVLFLDI